jgi:hypothetical protein
MPHVLNDIEKIVAHDLGNTVLRHAITDPAFVVALSKLNVFEFGLLMELVVLASRTADASNGDYKAPGLEKGAPPDFFENPSGALKWLADYIRRSTLTPSSPDPLVSTSHEGLH